MKDSGIEWIGDIPKDWNMIYLKHLYSFEKGKNAALYTKQYAFDNAGEYPVYSGQTEDNGIMGNINTFDYDIDECLFTTTVGAKVMTTKILSGKFSLSQNCLVMKKQRETNTHFNYYVLNSLFDYEKSKIPSYMQPSLRIEDLKTYKYFIPQLSEQQKIADYLDKKCSKIDEQKANYEKSIELLKEYKQSFIDKSFQSIGNSEEVRIKNICYVKGRIGWQGLKADEFIDEGPYLVTGTDFQDGGINWDTCYHISMDRYNEAKEIQLKEKDLLVTKDGTVGKLAYIEELPGLTSLNSHLFVVRPLDKNKYDNKYLYRYLQTSDFKKYFHRESSGSIMESLTQETFLNYKLKLPNLNDQLNIVNNIEKSCKQIDKVISYREQMIEKLDEYKKSLIYECVTGKKEIK